MTQTTIHHTSRVLIPQLASSSRDRLPCAVLIIGVMLSTLLWLDSRQQIVRAETAGLQPPPISTPVAPVDPPPPYMPCGGSYSISGHVVVPSGEPATGIYIGVRDTATGIHCFEGMTDDTGYFILSNLRPRNVGHPCLSRLV